MIMLSINEIKSKALDTFLRFPIVIIAAFIGTFSMLYFVEADYLKYGTFQYFNWQKFILMCGLSIPLFAVVSFFNMRTKIQLIYNILVHLLILFLLIFYYFSFEQIDSDSFRYILYLASAFLLMTFSGFIGNKNGMSFWAFNKIMLLRLFTSLLFSFSLQLGLSLAVGAIQELFKVEWSNSIYLDIFVVMIGIFNTWYFLSGIPKNYENLENLDEYPKLLKLFSQYILIPLSILYLIILYAYSFKIIVQWQLPIGWTSSLIIAYSVIGILAFLLLYPFRYDETNKWAKIFSKFFFILLFPLLFLMALAINQRISDYGITEPRYFLIVLNIWLFGIAIYYSISKEKNIKIIPITLLIFSIAISFGPWSAFNISENSQINRVMNILQQKHIIENGKIDETIKIKNDDYNNLHSILYYLEKNHKLNNLISEINNKLDVNMKFQNDSLETKNLLTNLALTDDKIIKDDFVDAKNGNYYFDISEFKINSVKIDGYQYYFKILNNKFNLNNTQIFKIDDKNFKITINRNKAEIELYQTEESKDKIIINCKELLIELAAKGNSNLTISDFQKYYETKTLKVLFIFNNISGHKIKDSSTIMDGLSCDIYLKIK